MDSFRVSLASARRVYYERYHRPLGWGLADVERSISAARKRGAFVSLNYLVFPGFTDLEPEVDAVCSLIERTGVQMVQFRNLNIDPEVFAGVMLENPGKRGRRDEALEPAGMVQVIAHLQDCFPDLVIGNFSVALRG
jgi:pyruvate-formate lyase-activating enzyme